MQIWINVSWQIVYISYYPTTRNNVNCVQKLQRYGSFFFFAVILSEIETKQGFFYSNSTMENVWKLLSFLTKSLIEFETKNTGILGISLYITQMQFLVYSLRNWDSFLKRYRAWLLADKFDSFSIRIEWNRKIDNFFFYIQIDTNRFSDFLYSLSLPSIHFLISLLTQLYPQISSLSLLTVLTTGLKFWEKFNLHRKFFLFYHRDVNAVENSAFENSSKLFPF
jgi:hypothetical protein